jgi:hypothetical protein
LEPFEASGACRKGCFASHSILALVLALFSVVAGADAQPVTTMQQAVRSDRTALPSPAALDRLAARYRERWEAHPNGQWLLRILPVRMKPSDLPDAHSEAARLTARYCVQCHALPNPAMHGAQRWEGVVERMVPRMRGEGNQGRLMREMMDGIEAPDAREVGVIIGYLTRHAQQPLPLAERPGLERNRRAPPAVPGRPDLSLALASEDGRMFRAACDQCHELPDPAGHRAREWPAIIERMQANMQWMNRVVGSIDDPREPRLDTQRIITFLKEFASDGLAPEGPR